MLDGRHTPQNVTIYSFFLGTVFSASVFVGWYSKTFSQLGIFLAALSLFHELEYLFTALFNANILSLDSFLINNGQQYHIAHAAAIIEFLIEAYLFPNHKNIKLFYYIGFLAIVVGQIARSCAMWHAKHNFTHMIQYQKRKDHVLVTTGIYAYLRHPSYFGFYYWAAGTQILLCNPICLIGFLVAMHKFFSDRIREEELLLIKFFGNEYLEYQKKAFIWIPLINNLTH
ncbi:Isoprenylcysteine carboxyl methyltransferase family-domain-containing protein [Gigaspora rosea]|uniref:Protein-S-isoprenylcysteine O-methyltransferase n=1 Tax=Gigaspora rosea TaxID=44941 RepID=A0A397UW39_9GLOM|nr:Isoprenylcysteine carboxyl methyltransferase family-domain-containing protein [Gigaspora rosea]